MSRDAPPFTQLARVYDAIFSDVEYQDWCDFVCEVLSDFGWVGVNLEPHDVRVLDLACGTGSSSLPYLERGFTVTGADPSEPMLEVARAKLPSVAFHRQGFLDLDLPERFHLVISVFDSLNNLTDPDDLLKAFRRVVHQLEPGGWFAFDVNTRLGVRELWDDDRFEGEVKTADGPARYVWTHRYDPATGLGHISAHVQIWADGQLEEFTEHHSERGYDPLELAPLLERAGFYGVRFLEYPDQAVPSVDSPRVWGFAQKPPGS